MTRWGAVALVALALGIGVSQWLAIRTENVNWDEFAFLDRVQASLRSGRIQGAGRPGLAVLFLMPIVKGCSSGVETAVAARQLWFIFTVAYLAGVFALVWQALRDRRRAWQSAAAAVALLTLVPAFLRWSLQVRTDQPALMFACWGAACLLASLRRPALAAPAGLLFALGYLCTQKAAYVAALALVILVIRLTPDLDLRAARWRQGAAILLLSGAGFIATIALFGFVVSRFYEPASVTTFQGGLGTFAYYRRLFGYRAYRAMVPGLYGHLLIIAGLFGALIVSGRRALRHRSDLIASWTVLLLGLAVGVFHGGAFPYFWMTLGLFPAVAIAIGWAALTEAYGAAAGRGILVIAGALLVSSAAPAARALHQDTQRVQRDAESFIARNFNRDARGFQTEGALLCRSDPQPFPAYFADGAARAFGGADGRARTDAFIGEFRSRPVSFLIVHRLFAFPEAVREFWDAHYVLYKDEVMVPGREIRGRRGGRNPFEVIVPGRYRWIADAGHAPLSVGTTTLQTGETIELRADTYIVTLDGDASSGILALALGEEPQPEGAPFYAPAAIRELDPLYPRFRR